jgi:hypothetical protein
MTVIVGGQRGGGAGGYEAEGPDHRGRNSGLLKLAHFSSLGRVERTPKDPYCALLGG